MSAVVGREQPPTRDDPWWFLGRGPVFVIVLAIALMAAGMARYGGTGSRILLEFVLGTWPNQTYGDYKPDWLQSSGLMVVGVLLQTLFLLAVPVLLGLWVSYVTARTERRLRMQMTDYLQIREGYIEERVYLKLADALTEAGFPDDEGRAIVAEAFQEGRQDFEAAEADRVRKAIRETRLPDPREN